MSWLNPLSWFRSVRQPVKQANQFAAKRMFFAGADASRLYTDWIQSIATIDSEIKADSVLLRVRARDLAKNNPYIKQFLNLLVANVLGASGIKLQAQIRNNDGKLNTLINSKIEDAWKEWGSEFASVDGKLTLNKLSELALKTIATDGEVFIRKVKGNINPWGFSLQLIDSDLVDWQYNVARTDHGTEIRMGIEIDDWGRPVKYHVFNRYPVDSAPGGLGRTRLEIPADEIIHLYDPARLNQTRGVTWFNSVMLSLKMLCGYTEAELTAARVSSAKMGFIEQTDPSAFDPSQGPQGALQIDAAPGSIETLPFGTKFTEWSPDHPANAFPSFIKAILREVSTGLGVSYNALANDLEGVNYSSIRAGLLIERDLWKMDQQWWIDSFLSKIYKSWLPQAMLSGNLILDSRDPKKFNKVKWMPRGWAWVDPLKDVKAAGEAIALGLSSRNRVLAEKGEDFEEIAEDLAEEKSIAEQYGITLTSEQFPKTDSVNADNQLQITELINQGDAQDAQNQGKAA